MAHLLFLQRAVHAEGPAALQINAVDIRLPEAVEPHEAVDRAQLLTQRELVKHIFLKLVRKAGRQGRKLRQPPPLTAGYFPVRQGEMQQGKAEQHREEHGRRGDGCFAFHGLTSEAEIEEGIERAVHERGRCSKEQQARQHRSERG